MPVYIATDEAGYGPKLGPLVVAASAWNVDPGPLDPGVSDPIIRLFNQAIAARALEDGSAVVMGDSKKLFRRADVDPLATLENAIIAWLNELWPSGVPETLGGLLEKLAQTDITRLGGKPWFGQLNSPVPITGAAKVAGLVGTADSAVAARENLANISDVNICDGQINADPNYPSRTRLAPSEAVRLIGLAVRVIDATEFNRLCRDCGNKATLLSETTVCLVRDLLDSIASRLPQDTTPTYIFSDRHGGRQRYAGLLQQFFPGGMTYVASENKQCSRYHIRNSANVIDWRFSVKGDSFGPVAFSSMVAKYLRERMMGHFNEFWIEKYGQNLKPTAGYPVDADRFCEQIAGTAKLLGIEFDQFIRER